MNVYAGEVTALDLLARAQGTDPMTKNAYAGANHITANIQRRQLDHAAEARSTA
jgi:hypothetical protein